MTLHWVLAAILVVCVVVNIRNMEDMPVLGSVAAVVCGGLAAVQVCLATGVLSW